MKIGILTYHSSHNYGAFLQAYALCNALKENTGNDVEIINYSSKKADDVYLEAAHTHQINRKKSRYQSERYEMFEFSSKKFHKLSGERLATDDIQLFTDWIKGKYDAIVVGSDEIWKLDGFRGFPNAYWLPGVTDCRKLSYAASSRNLLDDVTPEVGAQLRDYLSSFDYIGVRDFPTKELIESVIPDPEKIHMNCDPTFAYNFHTSKEKGKQLLHKKFGVTGQKKCIALMLQSSAFAEYIVETYKKDFDFISLYDYQVGTKGYAVLDPFEWIEAIAGADGLITEFFHGMVFALKNNTPFISLEARKLTDKKYSKAYDLLHRYGLDDHFFMRTEYHEQTLREIGNFLADLFSGKAKSDFQLVREGERRLFTPFLSQFPDLRPKHISLLHKEECCGCKACESACPAKAISMKKDEEGFWYPEVDQESCVECGQCRTACTFNDEWGGQKEKTATKPINVFGVKHRNEGIRVASRSGGIFTAISDQVLSQGGAVYGAALNSSFCAEHKRAVTPEERNQFRGSKYIQSDMGGIYSQIRQDLREGKTVLFSGTPCQVSAVRKAMEKENCEKLYLVDIVCHGVPSPMVWRDYLDYEEKKHGGSIEEVNFRNKKFGWKAHYESFKVSGNEYDSTVFTTLFYSHHILRPSCFECKYKCISRVSDITIADYWGVDKAIPGFNDNKGVSLVLTNTEKGLNLFDLCREEIVWKEARLEDSMQNGLWHCYTEPAGREQFWEKYHKTGMEGYLKAKSQKEKEKRVLQVMNKGVRFPKRIVRRLWRTLR